MSGVGNRQFMLSSLLARDPEAGRLHTRHLEVLEFICSNAEPVNATIIATGLDISQPQLSRLLSKLEEHGLISRTDNKPAAITHTVAGRALIIRVRTYVAACLETTTNANAA